jgi:hypothetical protein
MRIFYKESFPLYGGWRFSRDVIDYSRNAANFVHDAI